MIYVEQEQIELSQCVIGANPNAVAQIEKAYKAGVLNDSDIVGVSAMAPDFARAFERQGHRSRSYSFAPSHKSDAVADLIRAFGGKPSPLDRTSQQTMKTTTPKNDFSRLSPETKAAFENLEFARRGNGTEIELGMQQASFALARERRMAGDPVERYLKDNPIQRYFLNGLARKLGGGNLKVDSVEYEVLKSLTPGLVSGDSLGRWLFPILVSPDIFDLLLIYGAFRDLGVSQMPGQYTKFVIVNGLPLFMYIPATHREKSARGLIRTCPASTSAGRELRKSATHSFRLLKPAANCSRISALIWPAH